MGSRFHLETVWGRRSGRGHGIGFVPGVAFKLCSSGPTPTTVLLLVLDLGSEWWKKLAGFMYLLSCTCRPTRPWLTLCY